MIISSVKRSGFFVLLAGLFLLTGCGKVEKKPEEMSFNELKEKVGIALERNKHSLAIPYLEQLVAQYPENQDIFEYKFILADLYMKVGRLEEAHLLYKNYTKFYPSEARAEQAHYKSILSKFYQTLKVSRDCDDIDTQHAIKQCQAYLKNNLFKKHRDDVRDIQYTCERRLIDKEIYVFNTYLRRKKFQSAQQRITYLRTTFLEKHPELAAQILYLEGKLALKKKDEAVVKAKIGALLTKYPDSRFTKMAHSMVSKKKETFKFV
ncbi:outer membrane protein assembly factor BamD [Candidatus Dependentiae bacterium]|nr:outer membrane protein assembly factor BamD [Candidatus Dependentiae bacterium]